MTAQDVESRVEHEAIRLKTALREALGDAPAPGAEVRTDGGPAPDAHACQGTGDAATPPAHAAHATVHGGGADDRGRAAGPSTAGPSTTGSSTTGSSTDGATHAGSCADESCPVCRVSRAAHETAPALLDELARGLTLLAGATRQLADGLRHTTDHPGAAEQTAAPTDEERS